MRCISSRQAADVESYRRDEGLVLPEDIDYAALPGLPTRYGTSCKRIVRAPSATPAGIDGMTPAALTLLVAHLHREGRKRSRGAA